MMVEPTPEQTSEPVLDDKPAKRKRTRSPGRKTALTPALTAQLKLVGGLWATRDELCGGVMLEQAPAIAEALNMLAMDDPKIYERLSMASTGGGWVGLFMATSPLLAVVTSHHLAPMVQRRREARANAEAAWSEEPPPPGEGTVEDNRVPFTENDFDAGR